MRKLSFEIFVEKTGILKSSIDLLLAAAKDVYMKFFTKIMTNVESGSEVIHLLFGLTCEYENLYDTSLSSVTGCIEKHQKDENNDTKL